MGWFKRIKRAAVAVATGGFSETIKPMREGLKEVTGVNAMEDANDLAQKQYDEQKAAAAAEEKAATEAASASLTSQGSEDTSSKGALLLIVGLIAKATSNTPDATPCSCCGGGARLPAANSISTRLSVTFSTSCAHPLSTSCMTNCMSRRGGV